jgi:hypothetical protein
MHSAAITGWSAGSTAAGDVAWPVRTGAMAAAVGARVAVMLDLVMLGLVMLDLVMLDLVMLGLAMPDLGCQLVSPLLDPGVAELPVQPAEAVPPQRQPIAVAAGKF